jgi:hypothetical protein
MEDMPFWNPKDPLRYEIILNIRVEDRRDNMDVWS